MLLLIPAGLVVFVLLTGLRVAQEYQRGAGSLRRSSRSGLVLDRSAGYRIIRLPVQHDETGQAWRHVDLMTREAPPSRPSQIDQ